MKIKLQSALYEKIHHDKATVSTVYFGSTKMFGDIQKNELSQNASIIITSQAFCYASFIIAKHFKCYAQAFWLEPMFHYIEIHTNHCASTDVTHQFTQ